MNNMTERNYLDIMQRLITDGDYREGRNGGVYSLFGEQMRFDLSEGFPLLTTKRVHFKSVVVELLWFLRGDTNARWMEDQGVNIWREWGDPKTREMGRIYGAVWRDWLPEDQSGAFGSPYPVDQISEVIESLRIDPYSRRHIVTAWNPAEVKLRRMALPPCHVMFQFHVSKGRLNCHLYQRSADWFLGVPFNIASYALLTHLMAREVGLQPGEFIHSFGDLHLYANHIEAAQTQLDRSPRDLPVLRIDSEYTFGIFGIHPENVEVIKYDPHPAIKAEVSA